MQLRRTLLALAATAAMAGGAEAADKIVIVKGDNNVLPSEEIPLYAVAHELGYFKAENLDVEFKLAQGSNVAAQLLQTGVAHVATVAAEVALKLREQGGGTVVFYNLKTLSGYSVAVTPNSPIKQLTDLRGKTIGTSTLGTGFIPVLVGDLDVLGLKRNTDYTIVAAGTGAPAATALTTGKVDALGLWETAYGAIENQGVAMRYIDVPVLHKLPAYVLATTDGYLARNRSTVERYCRAVTKATVFAEENPAAAVVLFHRAFPLTQTANTFQPAELAKSQKVFEKWSGRASGGRKPGTAIGTLYPEQWSFAQTYYKERGVIDGSGKVEETITNDLIGACNNFDAAPIKQAAKSFKS